jgi:hypothetical protein
MIALIGLGLEFGFALKFMDSGNYGSAWIRMGSGSGSGQLERNRV